MKNLVVLLTLCVLTSSNQSFGQSQREDGNETSDRKSQEIPFETVYQGHAKKVLSLINEGADINAKWSRQNDPSKITHGWYGCAPLHVAVARASCPPAVGHEKEIKIYMEMLELILAKGANPNIRSDDTGETPLFELVSGLSDPGLSVMVAQILLEKGADPNAKDSKGHTVVSKEWPNDLPEQRADLLKVLLDHGADVTGRTPEGKSVAEVRIKELELLALDGHTKAVEILTQAGFWFTPKDKSVSQWLATLHNGALPIADRAKAAMALGELRAVEAVPHLCEIMKAKTVGGIATITFASQVDYPIMSPVASRKSDSDCMLRCQAANALGNIGGPDAVHVLARALEMPTLIETGPDGQADVVFVFSPGQCEHIKVRIQAAKSLVKVKPPAPPIHILIEATLKMEEPVSAECLRALNTITGRNLDRNGWREWYSVKENKKKALSDWAEELKRK